MSWPRVLSGGALAVLALAAASCSTPLMKLPALPPADAPIASDAPAMVADVTRQCRGVRTLTAEVAVSGTVSGQRIRVRLTVGVERPDSARVEANAPFGAPFFIFATTGGAATLLMPRDDRVLRRGAPDRVLDAAAGVPLDAAELRTLLTGCVPEGFEAGAIVAAGDDWRVWRRAGDRGSDAVYFHRDKPTQSWQLVSAFTRRTDETRSQKAESQAWRAEYQGRADGIPQSIRLTSVDAGGDVSKAFDLTLGLSQVDTNVAIEPAAFRVEIPPTAQPITLEELRSARPGSRED